MKAEQFNEIVVNRVEACKNVLIQKAEEYATDEDRLANFKVSGRMKDCGPEEALRGIWVKHLASIFMLIDDLEAGKLNEIPDDAWMKEKFTDNMNYLMLLEALLIERRGNKNEEFDFSEKAIKAHIVELDSQYKKGVKDGVKQEKIKQEVLRLNSMAKKEGTLKKRKVGKKNKK